MQAHPSQGVLGALWLVTQLTEPAPKCVTALRCAFHVKNTSCKVQYTCAKCGAISVVRMLKSSTAAKKISTLAHLGKGVLGGIMAGVVANVESSGVTAGNLAAESSQPVALVAGSAHAHIGTLHGLAHGTAGHHLQCTLVGSTACLWGW